MPYKHETENKRIPKDLKRSAKLTIKEREEIFDNVDGLSQRKLAAKYNVSRRLIVFIQRPEAQRANYQRRVERGGSMLYYIKDKNTEAIKDTRRYKKRLDDDNLLED